MTETDRMNPYMAQTCLILRTTEGVIQGDGPSFDRGRDRDRDIDHQYSRHIALKTRTGMGTGTIRKKRERKGNAEFGDGYLCLLVKLMSCVAAMRNGVDESRGTGKGTKGGWIDSRLLKRAFRWG